MTAKPFEKWKTQEVENTFGINQISHSDTLNKWLSAQYTMSIETQKHLTQMREKLSYFIGFYSEADISMFFISPVLMEVDFIQKEYRAYMQLPMKLHRKDVHGNDIQSKGIVEMAIARGKQIPETPFFFLNEYKPEKRTGSESDPLGQLLIAMLAAQVLNKDEYPIYGCYVNGRNWHFVVLEGNEYAVSDAYVTTQDDIYQVYAILMEMKRYIHLRLNLPFPN